MCVSPLTCDPSVGCRDATCSESPCRTVSPQCGCPSMQGCYLDGAGARTCAPAGTSAEGDRCDADICSPGNLCVNVHATAGMNLPMCKHFCDGHGDCTGAGSRCLVNITGSTDTVCTRHCDPSTNAGCPASTYCAFFTEMSGRVLTDCQGPPGATGQGGTCTDDGDCQVGFGCIGSPTSQCLRWCLTPGTVGGLCGACPASYGFMTPLVFNRTEYGVRHTL